MSTMNSKQFSSLQENRIADYLNWSVVKGSGARPTAPGDIISSEWLGECKTHEVSGKPIYFNLNVWTKICAEAQSKFRRPALFTDDGSQSLSTTWCMFNVDLGMPSNVKYMPIKSNRSSISFEHTRQLQQYAELYAKQPDAIWCYVQKVDVDSHTMNVGIVPISIFALLFRSMSGC